MYEEETVFLEITESETSTEAMLQTNHAYSFEKASLIVLIAFIALCYFQSVISYKENKKLGLIIPFVTFALTIILTIVFSFLSNNFVFGKIIGTIIVMNIPTLIFLIIYYANRKRYNKDNKKKISVFNH